MREVNLDDLEMVAGGLTLGALGTLNQQQAIIPGVGGLPIGGTQPFFDGNFGGDFHEGRWAFREFAHDPTFQTAVTQYAALHPDQAQALAPLVIAAQEGGFRHAMREVMHDPVGRAALDQLLDDPNFLGAVQQFSAANPDIGAALQSHVARLDARLESGQFGFQGFQGQQFGQFGPQFGPPFGAPFGSPFAPPGQAFGVQPQGSLTVGGPIGLPIGSPIGIPGVIGNP